MKVRKAVIDDIDAIAALYREQFCTMKDLQPDFFREGAQSKDFIRDIIECNESDILVITESVIVGFVLLQTKETPDFPFFIKHTYAYVMDIVMTRDCRGKGMGSILLEEAKKWAIDRELEYVELDVLSNNATAIQFYKKHGFTDKRQSMFCRL